MSLRAFLILGILAMVIGIVASSTAFTVNQTNQAIVLQFGEPKRVITQPGLHWKLPFIQDVLFFEKRVLDLNVPKETILLSDQKRLLVDALARYRITDPLLFFQRVRTEDGVRQRLGAIVKASLRGALGNVTLASVLSEERAEIMRGIGKSVNRQTVRFGIEVLDIRLRRADFPAQVAHAIYTHMRSNACPPAPDKIQKQFEFLKRVWGNVSDEARGKFTNWLTSQ